jgi:hypothetical protein
MRWSRALSGQARQRRSHSPPAAIPRQVSKPARASAIGQRVRLGGRVGELCLQPLGSGNGFRQDIEGGAMNGAFVVGIVFKMPFCDVAGRKQGFSNSANSAMSHTPLPQRVCRHSADTREVEDFGSRISI